MKIVVLDAYTVNPGDKSWASLEALGEVTLYDRTAPCEVDERITGAEIVYTNKVVISADERAPVARMGLKGKGNVTGRVVDTEGMVFIWQRGTQTLPTIRETQAPGTPKGQRITGRTLAALRLIEACREPDFTEFGVLEVDVSKPDFLVATLGNYSTVKIAWEGMDDQTPASRADLVRKLTMLRKAIRSQVAPDAVIWNATMPDEITGDTQKRL